MYMAVIISIEHAYYSAFFAIYSIYLIKHRIFKVLLVTKIVLFAYLLAFSLRFNSFYCTNGYIIVAPAKVYSYLGVTIPCLSKYIFLLHKAAVIRLYSIIKKYATI